MAVLSVRLRGEPMTEPWYNSAHAIEHQGHTLVYQRGNAVLGPRHD